MTELQKTEFAILQELDRVCNKLEIPYFLVCGSALGAVKYQGFIPWDDDIDVAMCREDYERFIKEGPDLLPEHLFLQNYHTDPAFPQIFSKLRNSNTTYMEKSAIKLPIHQGVFIDIFPLDGYPKQPRKQKQLEFFKRVYSSMLLSAYDIPRKGVSAFLNVVYHLVNIHRHTSWVAVCYERMVSRFSVKESEMICNHGNWQGKLDYSPKSHFGEGSLATFEGLTVRIPVEYDAYLTQKYGAWREDLPPEEQRGHHYYIVCDCAMPYTKYMNHIGGK